jgi:hypothetical protein
VAFPDVETLPALRRMAAATIQAVCTGRLGSLSLAPPAVVQTRRRPWRVVLEVARVLSVAVLPFATVMVLRRYGIVDQNPMSEKLVLLSAGWGVVTLMVAVEPQFRDRISAVNDLFGVLFARKKE